MTNWKQRYFILEEGILSYYEDKDESSNNQNPIVGKGFKGKIDLTGYSVNQDSKGTNSTGKNILTNGIHLVYDRSYGQGTYVLLLYYVHHSAFN